MVRTFVSLLLFNGFPYINRKIFLFWFGDKTERGKTGETLLRERRTINAGEKGWEETKRGEESWISIAVDWRRWQFAPSFSRSCKKLEGGGEGQILLSHVTPANCGNIRGQCYLGDSHSTLRRPLSPCNSRNKSKSRPLFFQDLVYAKYCKSFIGEGKQYYYLKSMKDTESGVSFVVW